MWNRIAYFKDKYVAFYNNNDKLEVSWIFTSVFVLVLWVWREKMNAERYMENTLVTKCEPSFLKACEICLECLESFQMNYLTTSILFVILTTFGSFLCKYFNFFSQTSHANFRFLEMQKAIIYLNYISF